jgi:hypothetical protein
MTQWGTTEPEQPIRDTRIFAPWTDDQVVVLNGWQESPTVHPFTCGGSVHEQHRVRPSLVAVNDGWMCPDPACNYRQNWAHSFMADSTVLANMNEQQNRLLGEFFDAQRLRQRGAAKMRQAQGLDPHDELVEQACEVMHDAYEKAALGTGWATNPESRKPWADVPEANKETMRASVGALFLWLATAAPGARLITYRDEEPT